MSTPDLSLDRIDAQQRRSAKVAGLAYLLALAPAVFAEFYARGQLIVSGDAARTAANIQAHETLFRLGITSNLAVFAIDAALITALYVVLQPVHRRWALLALAWGLIETTLLVVATLSDLDVLRILAGAGSLHVGDAVHGQALAQLSIGAHGDIYNVGLVFAGLRSTAFCALWYRTGWVPRSLAAAGVGASALMGTCCYLFIVFPELAGIVPVAVYGGPIFVFELAMGSWLTFAALRSPQAMPA